MSELPAAEMIKRDAKEYEASGGQMLCIAQVETVGKVAAGVQLRADRGARRGTRPEGRHSVCARMVTDIVTKGTGSRSRHRRSRER